MEEHHPVANLKFCNIFSGGGHCPGRFMSEDAGRRVGSSSNFLQIGAADAAGVHLNQDFAGPNGWNWYRLQPDIVYAMINSRGHGRRNGPLSDRASELCRK
jgi:hypothetical protein